MTHRWPLGNAKAWSNRFAVNPGLSMMRAVECQGSSSLAIKPGYAQHQTQRPFSSNRSQKAETPV